MASSSVPPSEVAPSKTDSGSEGQLDVSVLRELARKALVDSLNSVSDINPPVICDRGLNRSR